MNRTNQQSLPRPESDCGAFVDLLPLLGAGTLGEQEEHRLRLHLANCAYCRLQQSTYDRMDLGLRRAFGAPATLPLSPEEILALPEEQQHVMPGAASGPVLFQPTQGRHPRRAVSLLSALAAVLLIIVVVTAIVMSRAAQPNTGTPPQVTSSSTPAPVPTETAYKPTPHDGLRAVQMLSPTEGWAVGSSYVAPSATGVLILHYHNGQWRRVPVPSNAQLGVPAANLSSIAMVSADEGWAVGGGFSSSDSNYVPSAFILHYSGGRWTRYGSLMRDAELSAVQMLSPTDGWIGGSSGGPDVVANPATSLMLHYDGTRWIPVQVPPVVSITRLDVLSATDGWATGEDKILHYDGQQWTIFQEVPQVTGLAMDSASDGWATSIPLYDVLGTVFWHYNGKQWVKSTTVGESSVSTGAEAFSMDSATDGWAVGGQAPDNSTVGIAFYVHYSQGHWTIAQGPRVNVLFDVTMLSADEGWAVGNGGVVLHYQHGAWSQYQF
jgi:hypothetical protein